MSNIRLLFLFVSALLFLSTVKAQDINVTMEYPGVVYAGDSFTMYVTIEKKGIQGFARLQQHFPEGFSADSLENMGASFSFNKQKAGFVWLNFPAQKKFTIVYKVYVNSDLKGTYQIGNGELAYMLNNNIEKYLIRPFSVNVVGSVSDIVAEGEETEETIEITFLQKTNTEPESDFPVVDTIPVTDIIEEIKTAAITEHQAVQSTFSDTLINHQEDNGKVQDPKVDEPDENDVAKLVDAEKQREQDDNTTAGLFFRVQIGAFSTNREKEFFREKYAISDALFHEERGGLHVYTFGNWKSYEEANKKSDAFRNHTGIKSFVVAYRDGVRIPVKEAVRKE